MQQTGVKYDCRPSSATSLIDSLSPASRQAANWRSRVYWVWRCWANPDSRSCSKTLNRDKRGDLASRKIGAMNRDSALQLLRAHKTALTQRFGVQFYLEDLLRRALDLVIDKALRGELRLFVEKEALEV